MNKIKTKIEEDFKQTVLLTYGQGHFSLLLPVDDRWSTPIPKQPNNTFVITISNWAHKEFQYDNETITITTAFGDTESTATFKWHEILGLLTEDLKPLLLRAYEAKEVKSFNVSEYIKGL